jgi:biotin operon repressor
MEIINLIPFGSNNCVSRYHLCMASGMPDRAVRKEIERLRKSGICILNHQDGRGYYRPTKQDRPLVEMYLRQEENRAKSIFQGLCGVRHFLKG